MAPEGWSVKSLGSILERIAKPVTPEPTRLYQQIGIRSHGKGIFYKEPVLGEALGEKRVFEVLSDCLVLNIVFAWEQAVARTTRAEAGMIASHRFPMYRPKDDACDVDYLVYFFKSKKGKSLLELASPGGAGRNKTLGQNEFLKLAFLMPSVRQQRRVAEIIASWDRAIEIVGRLISNAEAKKKGLMHLLLADNGSLRSGSSRWKTRRLADVAEIRVSNVDKKSDKENLSVRLCNYVDVYHNRYITSEMNLMEATATTRQIDRFSLIKGDVIITKDSESPSDIAVPALVRDDLDLVVCGYHLAIVRPKPNKADGGFIAALFSLPEVRHYFYSKANGATRFGLSAGSINDVTFSMPDLEGQRKIAGIMVLLDDEIKNLSKQRESLVTQKRVLMHQLLSGERQVELGSAA